MLQTFSHYLNIHITFLLEPTNNLSRDTNKHPWVYLIGIQKTSLNLHMAENGFECLKHFLIRDLYLFNLVLNQCKSFCYQLSN